MKMWMLYAFLSFLSPALFASPHTATLVFKKGDVRFLINPQNKAHSSGQQVLFENKYYKIVPAKLGRKIQLGDAVKAGPNGQAKLTFSNGDQFIVGPGSTYALQRVTSSTQEGVKNIDVLKLFYGKMRGIISKTGPRNQMKIQTRGTVAGVRGTDFFVSSKPEKVELTVLRGKVAIESMEGQKQEVEIRRGMSASVSLSPMAEKDKTSTVPIQLEETTKTNLLTIQKNSVVNIEETMKSSTVSEEVRTEIVGLENAAKKIVIEDIVAEGGEAAMANVNVQDATVEQLNSDVIFGLYKKAPAEDVLQKLQEEEFTFSDEEIYKKYFQK